MQKTINPIYDPSNLPLVTIGMVTYNQAKLVRASIESVLTQGYANFELIISDDCSTDETWEIVNSYSDERIIVTKTEKNVYQYRNRNNVIEKAKGKYLIFVDGDDLIYAHGLEYMVRMLEAFPECGMATTHFFRNNIFFPAVINARQFFIAEYFEHGFLGTSLAKVLFRTDVLREVGGFPTRHISSDDLVRFRIVLKYPFLLTYHDPVWWRETPGQQSNRINTVIRFVEKKEQMNEILNSPDCPLSDEEKYFARYKFNYMIWRQVVKHFISGRFTSAKLLIKAFDFRLQYMVPPPKDKVNRDPLPGYNAINPLSIKISQNPYSTVFDINAER